MIGTMANDVYLKSRWIYGGIFSPNPLANDGGTSTDHPGNQLRETENEQEADEDETYARNNLNKRKKDKRFNQNKFKKRKMGSGTKKLMNVVGGGGQHVHKKRRY